MKDKYSKSLLLQLGLIVIFSLTIVLTGFGVYQHFQNSRSLQKQMNDALNIAAERLSISLASPLYSFYEEGIDSVILSEMNDMAIEGIFLILPWGDHNKYWYINDGERIVKTDKILSEDDRLIASREIKYKDEVLGEVYVYMTTSLMKEELMNAFWHRAYEMILINIFLIFVLIVGLRIKVVNPVKKLKEAALKISKGNLNTKVQVRSKNELGDLALTFNQMTKDLKELNHTIAKHNKELEREVEKRTEEINKKSNELESFNKIAVGRELKMIELKKELRKFKKE